MRRGWQCVLTSLVLCWTFCATLATTHSDESKGFVAKRPASTYPYDSIWNYILVAMSNPTERQQSPQFLNRGVRRLGSEFLGKRSPEHTGHDKNDHLCQECSSENSQDFKKQSTYMNQYDYESEIDDEGSSSLPTKRGFRGYYPSGLNRDGLKNFFTMLMSKKMGSEFLGKRMGSEFLGKRALGSEFLGKRAMGSEFLGKRAMGSEFLGKRAMGSEFLGKRAMGSEFLGKRAMGSEFLGKRAMGSEFLGKRQYNP
ncbi:hypothetical protein SK128_013114 [Halocaridina rubra]|uniref:Uncharacterized protein n=1 Tax=Halocaridina rubra TaxID=373956 RepID=A0AAN8X2B6_HALRR